MVVVASAFSNFIPRFVDANRIYSAESFTLGSVRCVGFACAEAPFPRLVRLVRPIFRR